MKEILKLLKIIIILLPIYGLWVASRDSEIPILFCIFIGAIWIYPFVKFWK